MPLLLQKLLKVDVALEKGDSVGKHKKRSAFKRWKKRSCSTVTNSIAESHTRVFSSALFLYFYQLGSALGKLGIKVENS